MGSPNCRCDGQLGFQKLPSLSLKMNPIVCRCAVWNVCTYVAWCKWWTTSDVRQYPSRKTILLVFLYLVKVSGMCNNRARRIDTRVASERSPEVKLNIDGEDHPSNIFTKVSRGLHVRNTAVLMGETPCEYLGTGRKTGRCAIME